MSDLQVTVTLTTDLRGCSREHARFGLAQAQLTVAAPHSFLAATDGRVLALLPADARGDPGTYAVPLELTGAGPDGATVTVSLNGAWRREQRGKRGAVKEATAPPLGEDAARFPCAERVLPAAREGGLVRLTLDPARLLALSRALGGETVTLLVPPPRPDRSEALRDGKSVLDPVVVLGEAGVGLIVPLSRKCPAADDVAHFNAVADAYKAARREASGVAPKPAA